MHQVMELHSIKVLKLYGKMSNANRSSILQMFKASGVDVVTPINLSSKVNTSLPVLFPHLLLVRS